MPLTTKQHSFAILNKMSLQQKLLAKFYTYAFFNELVLIYPFYTLLFADTGITPPQISLLLIAWSATAFILEVPSGAIADKFNRKNVLGAAILLKAGAFASWLLFQNFWGFLAGFILWGASSALTSGTKEALLYDELAKLEKLSLYAKINGRMEALGLAATVIAYLTASALASYGYTPLLIASVAAQAASLLAIMLLPNSKRIESTGETGYFEYFKEGILNAVKQPAVILILVFIGLTALGAIDEYFSLLLREKNFDNSQIALWSAIITAFGIGGSLIAHKLENKKLPLELLLIFWVGLLFAALVFSGIATPIFLGLFIMLYYILKVVFTARLQHVVTDKTRATTTSVGGFLEELFAIIAFGIVGFVAGEQNYQQSLKILVVVIVVASILFWIFARTLRRRKMIEELGL